MMYNIRKIQIIKFVKIGHKSLQGGWNYPIRSFSNSLVMMEEKEKEVKKISHEEVEKKFRQKVKEGDLDSAMKVIAELPKEEQAKYFDQDLSKDEEFAHHHHVDKPDPNGNWYGPYTDQWQRDGTLPRGAESRLDMSTHVLAHMFIITTWVILLIMFFKPDYSLQEWSLQEYVRRREKILRFQEWMVKNNTTVEELIELNGKGNFESKKLEQ